MSNNILPHDVLRDMMACLQIMDTEAYAVNNPSLHAAALVCKNWLTPARQNIFRTICIRINPSYIERTTPMTASLMKTLSTAGDLVDFIRVVRWSIPVSYTFKLEYEFPGELIQRLAEISKAHDISHSIILSAEYAYNSQVLAMLDLAPDLDSQFRDVMWHFPEWDILKGDILNNSLALMRRMDGLDRLELSTNLNEQRASFPTKVLIEVFPVHRITSLSLLRAGFASSASFNGFLSSFVRLSNLELHHVIVARYHQRRDDNGEDQAEDIGECEHIHRVPPLQVIKGPKSLSGPTALVVWISRQAEAIPLRDLNLHGSNMRYLSSYHSLRTLKVLELDLAGYNHTVDLSACTALTSLTYFDQGRVSQITASLNTVNSTHLTSLTIRINSTPEDGWDAAQKAFQRLHAVRLLHFRFRLYPNSVRDVVSRELGGFEGWEWITWL